MLLQIILQHTHTPIKWKLLIVSITFVTHVAQLQPTTSTVLLLKVML